MSAQPPRCKLCGVEHWLKEPHTFSGPRRPLPVVEKEAPLNQPDRLRLTELEAIIEPRLQSWIELGEALAEIRDRRLYRQDYDTFESYCQGRWQMGRARANRLVSAVDVVKVLAPRAPNALPLMAPTVKNAPRSERVARELVPLKDEPALLAEAWEKTVEEHGPNPTAQQTAKVVERLSVPPRDTFRRDEPTEPLDPLGAAFEAEGPHETWSPFEWFQAGWLARTRL